MPSLVWWKTVSTYSDTGMVSLEITKENFEDFSLCAEARDGDLP
jgi:hypothetical protein